MAEYIEREAVLRAVQGQRSPCRSPAQNRMLDCLKAAVIRISAADVAPVVRCVNCKYHHDCGTHYCARLGMVCPDDSEFFCSYGKYQTNAGGGTDD